jgi:hypothetical protein
MPPYGFSSLEIRFFGGQKISKLSVHAGDEEYISP